MSRHAPIFAAHNEQCRCIYQLVVTQLMPYLRSTLALLLLDETDLMKRAIPSHPWQIDR